MSKKNIAIITGGNVAERGISLQSAATVNDHLNRNKYNRYVLELNGDDFYDQDSQKVVDKNDFSLQLNGHKIKFDAVFLMLHGHPAEDGCLQGYFELLGIPCTGSDHFVSALTFNKQACKDYLRNYDIPMAPSKLLRKGETINVDLLENLGLPLFVKPNKNGSSYGITKVNEPSEIIAAVEKAFQFDDEVIVEGFLQGIEYSNGVVRKDGEVIVLPITEIRSQNDFFDYKAKYEKQSEEITPAELSSELTIKCQALSKKLYQLLGCKGMVRFDYIRIGETFYFLEANTIPGFSPNSIYPQQAVANGWTITEVLDAVVEEALE